MMSKLQKAADVAASVEELEAKEAFQERLNKAYAEIQELKEQLKNTLDLAS
jgi:uncharacterized coiled-coil protein SlyX